MSRVRCVCLPSSRYLGAVCALLLTCFSGSWMEVRLPWTINVLWDITSQYLSFISCGFHLYWGTWLTSNLIFLIVHWFFFLRGWIDPFCISSEVCELHVFISGNVFECLDSYPFALWQPLQDFPFGRDNHICVTSAVSFFFSDWYGEVKNKSAFNCNTPSTDCMCCPQPLCFMGYNGEVLIVYLNKSFYEDQKVQSII